LSICSKIGKLENIQVSYRVTMMTRWPSRDRWPKWPIDPVTQFQLWLVNHPSQGCCLSPALSSEQCFRDSGTTSCQKCITCLSRQRIMNPLVPYRLFSTCSKVPMTMHTLPLLQVHVCFILGKPILKFYYTVQHSILQKVQHFYHPTICISAVFTVARWHSLCSTVTLSVTFLCCIQTAEDIVKLPTSFSA